MSAEATLELAARLARLGGTDNGDGTLTLDDTWLADLGLVKGSTGRNDLEDDDFCEDLLLVTG